MYSFLGPHQTPRSFFGTKMFRVKLAIFAYFGTFSTTQTNFGQSNTKILGFHTRYAGAKLQNNS